MSAMGFAVPTRCLDMSKGFRFVMEDRVCDVRYHAQAMRLSRRVVKYIIAAVMPRRKLSTIREAVELYASRSSNEHPNSLASRNFRYQNCPEACLETDLSWLKQAFPEHDHEAKHRLAVEYLGVWDTVGALGVPNRFGISKFLNRQYEFHDTMLSSFVNSARHAVAADERRRTFEPTMWTNLDELNVDGQSRYLEKIFPGTHGAVGGGGPLRGLSDAALEWVYQGARIARLGFDTDIESPLYGLLPCHRDQLFNEIGKTAWSAGDRLIGAGLRTREFRPLKFEELDGTVSRRWHDERMRGSPDGVYRPESLKGFWDAIESSPPTADVSIEPDLFPGIALSERRVAVPKRIKKYKVRPQDSLKRIAKQEMGGEQMESVLFLHNYQAGILYAPGLLHANREIEIPIYD